MAERTDLASQTRAAEAVPRSAREIRQDIAAKRESISETVDRLGERLHESLDWRAYVSQYPYVALGAAAGLGFLAAGLFKRRPTPRDRIIEAISETVEDITDRFRGNLDDLIQKKRPSPVSTVKATVTAIASAYIVDQLKKRASEALRGHPESGRGATVERTDPVSPHIGVDNANAQATRSSTAGSIRS